MSTRVIPFKKNAEGTFELDSGIKKQVNKAVAVMGDDKKPTAFARQMKSLKKQVSTKVETYNSNRVREATYRALQSALLDMLPLAHQKYLETKSESSAYAWNALQNSLKEVQNDLDALNGGEEQADRIYQIVGQAFQGITNNLIEILLSAQAEVNDSKASSVKELKKEIRAKYERIGRDSGQFMQETLKMVQSRVNDYLCK